MVFSLRSVLSIRRTITLNPYSSTFEVMNQVTDSPKFDTQTILMLDRKEIEYSSSKTVEEFSIEGKSLYSAMKGSETLMTSFDREKVELELKKFKV